MANAGGADHWNDRYASVGSTSVSWYEAVPAVSLELVDLLEITSEDSVIDVGGGASGLVDHLLQRGHHDVSVLDLSNTALEAARVRLGDPPSVAWIEADLLAWEPSRRWDVWHDRAVLHFLVSDADRVTYLEAMRRALEPNGAFVIGTFAEDGPTSCSSLPVRRHSADELLELLGDVDVVEHRRQLHRTPGSADQPFNWIAGRLR